MEDLERQVAEYRTMAENGKLEKIMEDFSQHLQPNVEVIHVDTRPDEGN